jgi:hypothetical protein
MALTTLLDSFFGAAVRMMFDIDYHAASGQQQLLESQITARGRCGQSRSEYTHDTCRGLQRKPRAHPVNEPECPPTEHLSQVSWQENIHHYIRTVRRISATRKRRRGRLN